MRPVCAVAWILVIAILHTGTINAQMAPVAGAAAAAAAAGEADITQVPLVVGKSAVLNTATPITRVSLTSSDIADALVTSQTQLLLHGKTPGTISMFVWNREGAVRRYEVVVSRDIARLTEQVQHLFPNEKVEINTNGKNVVLAGSVSSKEVAEKLVGLSAGFVEKKEDVVNLLQVAPPLTNQVLLRVRFAEVSRQALTELGLSLFTSPTGIHNTLGRVTTQQFSSADFSDLSWSKGGSDFGSPVTEASGKVTFSDFLNLFVLSEKYDLGVLIRALSQKGLFQSLAEPNLVAESGKEATFLAGGEFPIPVAQGSGANTTISVQFKEFGIRLGFTPIVDGDRVHLKVAPEVSSLDFGNAVVMNGFRIPALTTRRTNTELELRDGQTFAIAGLLNNQMNETMQKIPGIGDIPILGYLFRSKAAQKSRTELVVMITPQILREGSPGVTNALPKLAEPYMSPLDEKKSIASPPPAFVPGATTSSTAPLPVPAAAIATPTPVMSATAPNLDAVVPAYVPIGNLPAAALERPLPPPAVEPATAPEAPAPAAEPAEAPAAVTEPGASNDAAAPAGKNEATREEKRLRELQLAATDATQGESGSDAAAGSH
jgi:pilus assembly protein CpaC